MDPRVPPPEGPSPDVVHRLHDRYLLEIVEGLGLCPFARRCRELGRVHRPLFWTDAAPVPPEHAAQALAEVIRDHEDAEIVLLTFVDRPRRFADPTRFERFVVNVRDTYARLGLPHFYMVAFHPVIDRDLPRDRPLTREMLVPLIRRSPDPVIQCVEARVLERVRAQAQKAARERMLAACEALDPQLRAIVERSVQTDSELSADIARHNFAAIGQGDAHEHFERKLAAIAQARREAYGF